MALTPQQELELLELEREAAMRQNVPPVRFPVDISGRQGSLDMGAEMSRGEKALTGLASAATRVSHGLGFGGPNAAQDRQILGDLVEGGGGTSKAFEFGTEAATTAYPGMKIAQGVSKIVNAIPWAPQFLKSAAASKPGMAAVEGAAGGAVLSPDERTTGAAIGGVAGPLVQQVGNRVGRMFAEPVPQSREALALRNRGIDLTPGQGADRDTFRGRTYREMEDAAAQVPLVGYPTASARRKAVQQYQQDILRQATPKPENIRPDKTNLSNLRDIANADLDDAYRAVLAGKTLPKRDLALIRDVSKTINDPQFAALDPRDVSAAQRFLKANLFDKLQPGMDAQELFNLQTAIRRHGYKQTNESLKDLYLKAADDVYTSLDRQLPGSKAALDSLKTPRVNYGVLDKTMDRTPGSGEFKPSTLRSTSKKKSQILESLARNGEEVFGNKDPLVQRALTLLGLFGAGAGALEHSPTATAGGAAVALLAPRAGLSKTLAGRTAVQRRMAAELARGKPVTSGAIAAQIGQRPEEQ